MKRNLEEMSQEELTEFMNGPGTDTPGVTPLDLDDKPGENVKSIHQHTDTGPEDRTVEDWTNLMNAEEDLNNGVVDLSK